MTPVVRSKPQSQTGLTLVKSDSAPSFLTDEQKGRLGQLEHTIESGLKTFVEVGLALAEIREHKLYRDSYTRFEDYCQERWGWGREYARLLIGSAEVTRRLSANNCCQTIPICEGQARPLTRLPDIDLQTAAWERAQEIATKENRKLSAAVVEEAVAELRGKREQETPTKPRLVRPSTGTKPVTLLQDALRMIRDAKKLTKGWALAKYEAIEKPLGELIARLEQEEENT